MSTADEGKLDPLQEVAGRLKAIVSQLPPDWLTGDGDEKLAQLRRFVDQLIDKVTPAEQQGVSSVETREDAQMK